MNEKERKNREELFRVMQENPDLPVIVMVDSEIVADDGYNRWLGAWGHCEIGEYFVGEERIHFRESDNFDEIEAMSDEEAEGVYNSLPWIRAIIVNIDLPD